MLRRWVSRSFAILVTTVTLGAFGWAHAGTRNGVCTPPTIDGNIDDLTSFARCVVGCGIVQPFDSLDICVASNALIPCATTIPCPTGGSGRYFENGFDLTRVVLAYDHVGKILYLGYRVKGVIGDADGDGTAGLPAGPCPNGSPSFFDPAGIGGNETYEWVIDANCDNIPDYDITAEGPVDAVVVKVNGSVLPGTIAVVSGHDIEVKIPLELPPLFKLTGAVGSSVDGLQDESWGPLTCAAPDLHVTINKDATPKVLCPDATTTVTLTIANTSNVPITNVVVTDALPAHLDFVAASSGGSCALGQPTVTGDATTGQTLTWPPTGSPAFNMDIGQQCTITFQAHRIDRLCVGDVINHSTVQGSFQSPCFNGGQPV